MRAQSHKQTRRTNAFGCAFAATEQRTVLSAQCHGQAPRASHRIASHRIASHRIASHACSFARSQAALAKNVPVREALAEEKRFFESSSAYTDLAYRMGSAYLAKKLNELLLQHIRQCLPTLRRKARRRSDNVQQNERQQRMPHGTDPAFALAMIVCHTVPPTGRQVYSIGSSPAGLRAG